MTAAPSPFRTVFAIWPGMTHLDFTGPHQVLSRIPGSKTLVASRDGGEVEGDGLTFARVLRLADILACDLICVPGGLPALEIAEDEEFLSEIRRLARGARFVTSVCTGSLILAAAGLLVGRRAACHWAWRDLLAEFGAIPDASRVCRDGNIFTGGGVTAGIDFAFTILEEVCGRRIAQSIQLGLEYAPDPPFHSGRPELAPPEVLETFASAMQKTAERRRDLARKLGAQVQAAAAAPD